MAYKFFTILALFCTINFSADAQDSNQKYFELLIGNNNSWWKGSSHVFMVDDVLSKGWQFSSDSSFTTLEYRFKAKKKSESSRFSKEIGGLHNPIFAIAGDTLKLIYFYYPSEEDIKSRPSTISNGYKNYKHNGRYYFGFKFLILVLDEELLVVHELDKWSVIPPFSHNYSMDNLIFFRVNE